METDQGKWTDWSFEYKQTLVENEISFTGFLNVLFGISKMVVIKENCLLSTHTKNDHMRSNSAVIINKLNCYSFSNAVKVWLLFLVLVRQKTHFFTAL